MRGRSERIIGFELDHRPDDNAHRRERLLERMELREQRGLDAGAGLVVRPKPIAKRLDHVVGGDAEIRGTVLVFDHLENGLQHADDCAVRAVLAFGEPAQAVEVTEEFVRAVNQDGLITARQAKTTRPREAKPFTRLRGTNRRRWHDDFDESGRNVVHEAGNKPRAWQRGNRAERSDVNGNRRARIAERFV